MRLLQKEHLLIFQSTLPDPRSRAPVTAIARFQSTLPAWGETRRASAATPTAGISIHSPRMGRDMIPDNVEFNGVFQSTLPAWGETRRRGDPEGRETISIHSPRMGRDGQRHCWRTGILYFNPLSPHGERLFPYSQDALLLLFQSTLPAWGETAWCESRCWIVCISIHSPRMGRDTCLIIQLAYMFISIHSPRMGRDARYSS